MNNLASTTCPVCKGEKILIGRSRDPADSGGFRSIICDECGGVGVVPAEGDLAQWHKEALTLAYNTESLFKERRLTMTLDAIYALRDHLAAMPQPVNAELLDNLNTCASLLGDDYDLLDSKDDSHMAIRVKRVQEALVDARAVVAQAEKGAAG